MTTLADPTARIFPKRHRELFNRILNEENLKVDREELPYQYKNDREVSLHILKQVLMLQRSIYTSKSKAKQIRTPLLNVYLFQKNLGLTMSGGYMLTVSADVAESVDATDLNDLSALGVTRDAELLKFGETCEMAIPSQASRNEGSVRKV